MDQEELPDLGYLDQIRRLLWSRREFGQAAVMLGAGFSRNAENTSQTPLSFPLWNDIAARCYERLYPAPTGATQADDARKWAAIAGSGALRTASQFEAVFGRQELDALLLRTIPDLAYRPAVLHTHLLQLPWADIFTTNYDTLLERTQPLIYDRKYDIVLTTADIPGRMRPRIVKLHGSFPSQRPFIVTEEDFRTYPQQFAPFVNLVQQSIMENAFCLLGYSGDDPNFLAWSGWVRDNLRSSCPLVYLCGLLDLSPAQRSLLRDRNTIPIDLSPLFPRSAWPDAAIRQARAMEWLLVYLAYGKPSNVKSWPFADEPSVGLISPDLPAIPRLARPEDRFEGLVHQPELLDTPVLQALRSQLERKRLAYPGWVVASEAIRGRLWHYMQPWLDVALKSLDQLSPPDNLLLLYELNWQLEIIRAPLLPFLVELFASIVDAYDPYPRWRARSTAAIRPDVEQYATFPWQDLAHHWVELNFALIRAAREQGDTERFIARTDRLKELVKQRGDWHARWACERALFHLYRLDYVQVRSSLNDWPQLDSLPFWQTKRAAILAEMDELGEARNVAEVALVGIRSQIQPYESNYRQLSQEGWTILLLRLIAGNYIPLNRQARENYSDRLDTLLAYGCSPEPDIELWRLETERPVEAPAPSFEIGRSFDPEAFTVTQRFVSESAIAAALPSFAFLRMFEDGGLPIRAGAANLSRKGALHSAERIRSVAPWWSTSVKLRLRGHDVEEWFDRARVAALTSAEVDRLKELLVGALKQNIDRPGIWPYDVQTLCNLLSQLCLRFTSDANRNLLDMAMKLYSLPLFRRDVHLGISLRALFRRLFNVVPPATIAEKIPDLLALPIVEEGGFNVTDPSSWSDPLSELSRDILPLVRVEFHATIDPVVVANLLRVTRTGVPAARRQVVDRLCTLYDLGGLTSSQEEDFGAALWSEVSPDTGLPDHTALLPHAFLLYPEAVAGEATAKLKQYLLAFEIGERDMGAIGGSAFAKFNNAFIGGTCVPWRHDAPSERRVDWTADEIACLLAKINRWWAMLKQEFGKFTLPVYVRDADALVHVLSTLILSNLAKVPAESIVVARDLLGDMQDAGVHVLSALPAILATDPDARKDVFEHLRRGLESLDEEIIQSALAGVMAWYRQAKLTGTTAGPAAPNELLDDCVAMLVSRRQPGLEAVTRLLSNLAKELPELFTNQRVERLCVGLGYLHRETELPCEDGQGDMAKGAPRPTRTDLPALRTAAATFARTLTELVALRGDEIPVALIGWWYSSQEDVLPEVRRAWRSWSGDSHHPNMAPRK